MFHEISPHKLNNEYKPRNPAPGDYLIFFKDGKMILEGDDLTLPQYKGEPPADLLYLFSVDEIAFFLSKQGSGSYHDIQMTREIKPDWLSFAAATAAHLAKWYEDNTYCGKCAAVMEHRKAERGVVCPSCGNIKYPAIAPVAIVAITDGDKLLLTKYANGAYRRYALVAGFIEIGETMEEGVQREVMEEVGIKVKNIRYYKSQPWPFSQSLIMGFFADVEAGEEVCVDGEEIAEADWIHRDDLPLDEAGNMSVTWEMINYFRNGGEI